MKTKNVCILLLAALTMTACEYDDSALWEQVNQNTERIAALEAWQAETNTNIQSLQTLLNTADYITAVTPVMEEGEEVGYTISFLHSDPITIYHGTKGDTGEDGYTPQIGLTQQDDGNWYWTLDGELMADADGNPIRANGQDGQDGDDGQDGRPGATGKDAPTPQVKIGSSIDSGTLYGLDGQKQTDADTDAWYLSVDNGQTWYRITGEQGKQGEQGEDGEKGEQGDSFFKDAPKLSDDGTYYTFTLADGTPINVLAYTGIKVDFGTTTEVDLDYGTTETIEFTAEGSKSFTTDNLFIIAPDGWKAEVTLPTRAATEFTLTVTAPADAASGAAEGEILVMLDNGQGSTTIGRLKVAVTNIVINGTELTASNLEAGKLAETIDNHTDLTSITVTSGTLDETDWAAIKQSNGSLVTIDLEGATYEGTDKDNLTYNENGTNENRNTTLTTVKLPQGVTALGQQAFSYCDALTTIDLPDGLESIGNNAFAYCSALKSIDLPDGLKSIELGAFRNCTSLTSIDLPEGLPSIGNYAFTSCSSLTSITLPETLTSIGEYAFNNCTSLKSIDLPDGLESIGNRAFYYCNSLTSNPAGQSDKHRGVRIQLLHLPDHRHLPSHRGARPGSRCLQELLQARQHLCPRRGGNRLPGSNELERVLNPNTSHPLKRQAELPFATLDKGYRIPLTDSIRYPLPTVSDTLGEADKTT